MSWLDTLSVALLRGALAPFRGLPWRVALNAVGWLGRTLLPLTPAASRVRDNLTRVNPEITPARAHEICARVGDNGARIGLEYTHMDRFAREAALRVTGLEQLRAALGKGKGALVVSAHFGNWEAVRLGAKAQGLEIGMIRRGFKNAAFDRFAHARQIMAGEPVLSRDERGQLAMLRHLRRGGAMLILLDQRVGRGPELPFLGQPAQTSLAVAALARRTGAALVPARAARDATGAGFDVSFEPEIALARSDEAVMRAINARLSEWITADPGQWFWLHRRWKHAGDA